ncbi:hypothetical protein ABZ801_41450 [Actinomadura sp. NPDC047616]|uniref:hypothetical protein n=1 Tax=Actinomadura sp. NPDC047616 TaxID=3155914 RepID=UPI0033F69A17
MRGMLLGALALLAVIVFAATATAFAESYQGLKTWATHHRVPGTWRADIWPLQVDAYILAGEIVLLASAILRWGTRARLLGWTLTLSGLAASIVWNAGHVGAEASSADHITAAVPPIAAVAGLMAALAVIKRLVADPVPPAVAPVRRHDVLTSRRHDVGPAPAALTASPDGGIVLRPATPAARSAILSALCADLTAAVADTTGAVVTLADVMDAKTSQRQDVMTSGTAPGDMTPDADPVTRPDSGPDGDHGGTSDGAAPDQIPDQTPDHPDVMTPGRQDVRETHPGQADKITQWLIGKVRDASKTPDDGPDDDPDDPGPSGGAATGDLPDADTRLASAERAYLMSLPSDAARVRAVCDRLGGLESPPAEVSACLAKLGVDIAPAYVRTAIKRARRSAREACADPGEADAPADAGPVLSLVKQETG